MVSCSKCSVGKKGTGNGCQFCPGNSIAKFPGRTTCDECEQGRYATPEKTFCRAETLDGNAPIVQLVSANGNRLAVAWNAKDFSNGNATLTVMDKETQGNKYSRSRSIGLISPILLAPLPLASRVYQVQIQVRYANSSSPKSNLAYQGNAWKITSDCTDLQYLETGYKDMTKWACKSCPEGASCAGSITQYGIKARFGWWRETKASKVLFPCLHRAACLGAPNPLLETQFPNARTDSNETCDLAIFKPSRLCATCKEGYARGTGNGSCNRCHPVSNVVLFVFALIVGALGLLFLVRITVFKPRVVRLSDGIKKVGLSYLQLATLAMQVDVPWTEQLEQLFAWQSFSSNVSDAVLSLDCVLGWSAFNTFRLKFIMVMATPPLLVAASYGGIRAIRGTRSQFHATVILLWYLVFPSIVGKVATLFTCIRLGEKAYLVLDPEVVCWKGDHMVFSAFGMVAAVVYVLGMPVAGYLGLRWADRGSMDAREKFGILYDGYNEECWWWEVTVVARKVVVIMIGAFLKKGRSQILAALLTIATVMCMTAMKRPFVNNTLLNLEMVSLSLCFLTFWIGAMLLADRGNFVCTVGAWLVILCNVFGVFGLVGLFGKTKWKEKNLTQWCGEKKAMCWNKTCLKKAKKTPDEREWQGQNPLNGIELERK